ncbi:hypothetical protein B0H66DRAFT_526955 [Apodospora peruviana]|uniref:Uncharacterized protein n=1 Tax=Apodospora peruviana TaxID=516989 RepID=A0AAE0IS68_9PEZI|nr:hypothetical protein B0H66DRAFT_526955 [Apodospora peruviana]
MKWQTFTLSLFASAGLASPVALDASPKVYALRLSSQTQSLNGKYLGVNGTLVGVYKNSPSVLRFYPVPSADDKKADAGLVELHTYPSGAVDHALALVGAESHGLMDLTDVVNPAASNFPKGTKCDWTSFSLNKNKNSVAYAGGSGKWVAFPSGTAGGEWSVKWKSSTAMTIETYMPVDVVYEEVEKVGPVTSEFGVSS